MNFYCNLYIFAELLRVRRHPMCA